MQVQSDDFRKVLRVFIASPGDLVEERRLFRGIVDEVNRSEANRMGVQLEPLGWEDVLPGYGRPQELINEDVKRCDLMIMLLWKRWGTPTGEYSSGFEEEYELAKRLREDGDKPEIMLYFRKIPDDFLAGPGPQLRQVLEFKEKIESEGEFLYKSYEDENRWENIFREHLSKWLDTIQFTESHRPEDIVKYEKWLTEFNKPEDIDKYEKWLKHERNVKISDRTRAHYNAVASKIRSDFEKSEFWRQLVENLQEYDREYHQEKECHLLMSDDTPALYTKSFDSFLLKTFRKNIIENKNWPNDPDNGWVLPDNWHSSINDIVRTLIVVKYLDGVQFIIDKIKLLCEQNNLNYNIFMEAREEGYYAAHLYLQKEFEIPRKDWDTDKAVISIEIQVTTQLQDTIRKLLHKYYEERRKQVMDDDVKWQWDYKSDEFTANYLGHILHYVEGRIVELRDKQKEEQI